MLDALIAWQEDPQGGDEEDTFFNAVEVVEDEDDYVLTITGRDAWAERSSRWRVRAHQVRGVQLNLPEAVSGIEIVNKHPLLLPHAARRTELFVRNAPQDAARLLGDLWRACHRVVSDWIKPNEYINWGYGLLSGERNGGGMGQLAKGPRPLLEAYAAVAQEHAMQPSLVGDHPPVRWDGKAWIEQTEPLYVLLLNDSWVVAEHYTCERLDGDS